MGAIEKNIQALADQVGPACQVVAICGRNKALIKRLEAKQFPAGMQVCMLQTSSPKPSTTPVHICVRLSFNPDNSCLLLHCSLPLLLCCQYVHTWAAGNQACTHIAAQCCDALTL